MPRNVNASLKAADRIPGLRPKAVKVRGAPPPWADWVHKFGPLVTAVVSAIIFFGTLKYTIEPVYRRALLEEANARLETEKTKLERDVVATKKTLGDAETLLKYKEGEVLAANNRLGEIESALSTVKTKADLERNQANRVSLALAETKTLARRLDAELSAKVGTLDDTKKALAAAETDLEQSVFQNIRNLLAQDALPCSVNSVDAHFRNENLGARFEKPCIQATLALNEVPIGLLSVARREHLRATAIEVDAVHTDQRLALSAEGRALTESAAALNLRRAQSNERVDNVYRSKVSQSADELMKRYEASIAVIEKLAQDGRAHTDSVERFRTRSNEFTRTSHEAFIKKASLQTN